MTKLLKKLFGGLNIKWWHLILFAVICGVYTGVMAMLPAARDTSFQDISITFECWILFAIIIIVNGKTPLDSALKTFVFFLISQPLVYLVQVPFHEMGWELFKYYPDWFLWTLGTFPAAFVGHYMKKDKWWGLVILSPMLAFLAYHYMGFLGEAIHFFPNHLLSTVFCAATMLIYPLFIFKNKKIRVAGVIISIVLLLGASFYCVFLDQNSHAYDTQLLPSDSKTTGVAYDDTYSVYLADESFGTVEIVYVDSIECYMIHASFTNTGKTELTLESPEGEKYVFDLNVERYSYHVHRKGDAPAAATDAAAPADG